MSETLLPKDENPSIEEESSIFVYFMNIFLVLVIIVLIYKIIRGQQTPDLPPPEPQLPKLKRDFKVEDLKPYDGTGEDGRILIGCNGKVFDVTKGKRFYGPGGPYAAFAGRDASRCFATFSVVPVSTEYDDLSNLTNAEWESVREWEDQLSSKYEYVGKILKPNETHTNYEEEEKLAAGADAAIAVTAQEQDSNIEEKKDL